MQFTGHSLPVRQSMSVPWEFSACPILLANFRPRDFLSKLPLECVTSFQCITLNGILGRVEGQNITGVLQILQTPEHEPQHQIQISVRRTCEWEKLQSFGPPKY